jgi:hypothetical protein
MEISTYSSNFQTGLQDYLRNEAYQIHSEETIGVYTINMPTTLVLFLSYTTSELCLDS